MSQPLTRSASDKFVAGVCGGVARSLGVDSGLVRIVTVVLGLFFGIVVPIYLAMWLVLPLESNGSTGFDDLKRMFSSNSPQS